MIFRNLILISLFIIVSPLTWANNDKHLLLRLERLERMVENNSPILILNKIKILQKENQQLRSQLEELDFQHERLKSRIRALNEDMDRRVLLLENRTRNNSLVAPKINKNNTLDISDKHLENLNTDDKVEINGQQSNDVTFDDKNDIELQMQEQVAYQDAFELLKSQRYGRSESSFKAFIQSYPNGSYSPLAQYWLAESSYAQRNFKQSIIYYSDLLKNYPSSPKRVESLLKIAYCYYELGENKTAKKKLTSLIKKYPNSTEAGQAKRLIKKIK